jgi:hypothetical protein
MLEAQSVISSLYNLLLLPYLSLEYHHIHSLLSIDTITQQSILEVLLLPSIIIIILLTRTIERLLQWLPERNRCGD